MSKFIKGFNNPFIKYQSGNVTRVIDINEIRQIKYWAERAFIVYKDGSDDEIFVDADKEFDEFLMNHSRHKINLLGNIVDVDMMHEEQTLQEWLEQEGQL